LEQLLNDPDVPIAPDRVWELVAEFAYHERSAGTVGDDCGVPGEPACDQINPGTDRARSLQYRNGEYDVVY
jgi:hypothetical protein